MCRFLIQWCSYSEEKQGKVVDGRAKVLPYDRVNAELFYPSRKENKDTTPLVVKMAVEVAKCLLKELRDPNKAISDSLTSEEGVFSLGHTSNEEHQACIGKMATRRTICCSYITAAVFWPCSWGACIRCWPGKNQWWFWSRFEWWQYRWNMHTYYIHVTWKYAEISSK